jgi:lysozyme family protein
MSNPEIMRDVPPEAVQQMIDIYLALGAHPSKMQQPDGNFTVTALFDTTLAVAPLAMQSEMEADPAATGKLLEPVLAPLPEGDFAHLAAEYRRCFDTCRTRPEHAAEIGKRVTRIMDNANRYKPLAADTKIPWYFIAIVHMMESNTNFATHLHNGDPLTQRTVNVPRGRPTTGSPPFTWEASAFDALQFEGYTGLDDWNTATMLYRWERFNGMGYRAHGIFSPYLWSYSNLYEKGRFVKDGVFDPQSVSKQCGAGVLLKAMQDIV